MRLPAAGGPPPLAISLGPDVNAALRCQRSRYSCMCLPAAWVMSSNRFRRSETHVFFFAHTPPYLPPLPPSAPRPPHPEAPPPLLPLQPPRLCVALTGWEKEKAATDVGRTGGRGWSLGAWRVLLESFVGPHAAVPFVSPLPPKPHHPASSFITCRMEWSAPYL